VKTHGKFGTHAKTLWKHMETLVPMRKHCETHGKFGTHAKTLWKHMESLVPMRKQWKTHRKVWYPCENIVKTHGKFGTHAKTMKNTWKVWYPCENTVKTHGKFGTHAKTMKNTWKSLVPIQTHCILHWKMSMGTKKTKKTNPQELWGGVGGIVPEDWFFLVFLVPMLIFIVKYKGFAWVPNFSMCFHWFRMGTTVSLCLYRDHQEPPVLGLGQRQPNLSGSGAETAQSVWVWGRDSPICLGLGQRQPSLSPSVSGSGAGTTQSVWVWGWDNPVCLGLGQRQPSLSGSGAHASSCSPNYAKSRQNRPQAFILLFKATCIFHTKTY